MLNTYTHLFTRSSLQITHSKSIERKVRTSRLKKTAQKNEKAKTKYGTPQHTKHKSYMVERREERERKKPKRGANICCTIAQQPTGRRCELRIEFTHRNWMRLRSE